MLGVVGVAPFQDQVSTPGDLARWGGNLDYNQMRERATVYFTVYQAGAYLYVGLNAADIATLLANTVRYDIAEVVDPQIKVVAKISKDVLAQLPLP
jgi:acetamidase/formamidase